MPGRGCSGFLVGAAGVLAIRCTGADVATFGGASLDPSRHSGSQPGGVGVGSTAVVNRSDGATVAVVGRASRRHRNVGQAPITLDTYQLVTVPKAERGIFGPTPSQSGFTYYTFLVQLESLDPTYSSAYNPLSFVMRDDQGFEYPATYADQARQPALSFGSLVKGEKVQGWLTMVGPVATTYVELVYRSEGGEAIVRAAVP